jgi:hypothetical protein
VSEGVGGSCDWSVSDGSGDGLREEGFEVKGDAGSEGGGVSRRGRKANLGFCRCTAGLLGRRWARCGGCHGCGAARSFGRGTGDNQPGSERLEGVGGGDATGDVTVDESWDLGSSESKGRRPMGTAVR